MTTTAAVLPAAAPLTAPVATVATGTTTVRAARVVTTTTIAVEAEASGRPRDAVRSTTTAPPVVATTTLPILRAAATTVIRAILRTPRPEHRTTALLEEISRHPTLATEPRGMEAIRGTMTAEGATGKLTILPSRSPAGLDLISCRSRDRHA